MSVASPLLISYESPVLFNSILLSHVDINYYLFLCYGLFVYHAIDSSKTSRLYL